jgi:hypothetical protein
MPRRYTLLLRFHLTRFCGYGERYLPSVLASRLNRYLSLMDISRAGEICALIASNILGLECPGDWG